MEDRHGKVNTSCLELTLTEVDISLTRDRLGIVTLCNYTLHILRSSST